VTSDRHGQGTAVVVKLSVRRDGVALSARRHTGETLDLDVVARLDHAAARRDAMAVRRPLAVLITGSRWDECVLLGTSRRGPARRAVTLGSALALCQSGVHTVLTAEPAYDVPATGRPAR
jgi:hypothetical protein